MNLYIVGAGAFAREVLCWVKACPEWEVAWQFKGFIVDGYPKGYQIKNHGQVVDSIQDYKPKHNDILINGIANVGKKEKILPTLNSKHCKFATVVHPTAILGSNVNIGTGGVICPYSILTCDIDLGDFCSLNLNCSVGHDVTTGHFLHMNSYSEIGGKCTIGNSVLI